MKWGFIGCGNMGGTLAIAAAKNVRDISVSDLDTEKCAAFAAEIGASVSDNIMIASECDIIVLGVKPQMLKEVTEPLRSCLAKRSDFLIVSMVAGIEIAQVAAFCGTDSRHILRIMPNLCAAVGKGTILYVENKENEALVKAYLDGERACGSFYPIPEKLIDAGSAVSGCGPAFVYMFIESLADGGVFCGLPRALAQNIAAEMVAGAAEMVLSSGKHPGQMKDEVCSPGGSTIAGVRALENGAFRADVTDAVISAAERTKGLGK